MVRAVIPIKLNLCIGNILCSRPLIIAAVLRRLGCTEIAGGPLYGQAEIDILHLRHYGKRKAVLICELQAGHGVAVGELVSYLHFSRHTLGIVQSQGVQTS